MTLPVIVLAGSRDGENDPLARLGRVSHKALLPVAGIPMLGRVLRTLAVTPGLGTTLVSIENPEYVAEIVGNTHATITAAPTPSASVAEALDRVGTPCLVTTADHALLRPEWITAFLAQTQGCDLAVAIATRDTIERDVSGTRRTYIRLRDIEFSGCNLFWLGTPRARAVVLLWQRLQQNRKRPLKMALTLGISTLFLALTKRLDSQALCARIEKLTGAKVKLVCLPDGRAAVDVDKPSDLALAEILLSADCA